MNVLYRRKIIVTLYGFLYTLPMQGYTLSERSDHNGLNQEQREAVEYIGGPLLILAGAGSGKTKVITHRISHLIERHDISPDNIIALTFTNKAADEMRVRVDRITGKGSTGLWISTFHSACVRILRRDIDKLRYTRDFVIYDAHDSLSLIKECIKELKIPDALYSPKSIREKIGYLKNELIRPSMYKPEHLEIPEIIVNTYNLYQKRLQENNALDFDDLIMKAVLLFEGEPRILEHYKNRFQYIMVDEYQDTNHAQYRLVQLLSSGHRNICVVGDDDQCIYQWRGATIRNIMEFERDYPDVKIIKLEENYRSTQNILDASWAVVSKNTYRKEKRLWTKRSRGEKIYYYRAYNEIDEAHFITLKIKGLHQREGVSYKDIALFYRTNAQSRILEDLLMRERIPYRIYGGLKFFDRKEVKDILAYLRLVLNPHDSVSLKRIINMPARGIGKATIEKVEDYSKSKGISPVEAIHNLIDQDDIGEPGLTIKGSRGQGLSKFYTAIKKIAAVVKTDSASVVIKKTLEITGYLEAFMKEGTGEAEERIENLTELITAAKEYEERHSMSPAHISMDKDIAGFLDESALTSDADAVSDTSGSVSLMTLHISKGLEFPVVFITGMEGGIFPHISSVHSNKEMEEERRLCYVGITRAKERLFLTNAERRRIYGQEMYNPPSEFIDDIPEELINRESGGLSAKELMGSGAMLHPRTPQLSNSLTNINIGSKVIHPQFGNGVILQVDGSAEDTRLTIFFRNSGKKRLALKYTSLKVL
jgi:DNA helicase-2/ATP-dependent DNA helicase PcrA